MFEAPAIKLALELALDIRRQCSSLRRQVGVERGVMFFDKLIKEGTFRAMAFIDRRSNAALASLPAGSGNNMLASLRSRLGA